VINVPFTERNTMRTPKEMMKRILDFAQGDDRIRAVGEEGSRTNKNIPSDIYQDYDITFFVTDLGSFTKSDDWLSYFGCIIMMQKPEDMEWFPPSMDGFSYIMYFDDYTKIDLTLYPLSYIPQYLKDDKLERILLDKDGLIKNPPVPTDEDYWIKPVTPRSFDDVCNEFWNTTPYVMKGLCRHEILFAIDHLRIVREQLLTMLSWKIGEAYGYTFSLGKNYKFIDKYLPKEDFEALLSTYRLDSYDHVWESLYNAHRLFRRVSMDLAEKKGYPYPPYDENVTKMVTYFYQNHYIKP